MLGAVHLTVLALRRPAIGSLALGNLPIGQWRWLTQSEVAALYQEAGGVTRVEADVVENLRGRVARGYLDQEEQDIITEYLTRFDAVGQASNSA